MLFHLITLNSFIWLKNILICLSSKETRTQRRCLRSFLTIKRQNASSNLGRIDCMSPRKTPNLRSAILATPSRSTFIIHLFLFLILVVWMNLRIYCRCIEFYVFKQNFILLLLWKWSNQEFCFVLLRFKSLRNRFFHHVFCNVVFSSSGCW